MTAAQFWVATSTETCGDFVLTHPRMPRFIGRFAPAGEVQSPGVARLTRYNASSPESTMQLDDELCLCFHVTKRKVVNFLRVEKPRRESQLAECFGAGTGCGWCRPFLRKLFEQAAAGGQIDADLPTPEDYARQRSQYVREGGGTPPPGATPINDESP
jgi:bacterioferritin-associated ferredoxin